MAGVAEHGDAAEGPARDRRAVEHRPDEGLVDGVDHLLHLRMESGIGGAEIGHLAGLGPGFADPVLLLDVTDEVRAAGRPKRSSG